MRTSLAFLGLVSVMYPFIDFCIRFEQTDEGLMQWVSGLTLEQRFRLQAIILGGLLLMSAATVPLGGL